MDGFTRSCRVPDIPGVKLNAELLEGRTPVVIMEARPLKPRQLQVLNKHYFGRVGWRECCGKLGHCMARDSVLVVWSEEEAYYLHCLSLSHKQLPEVTFPIAESGA